MERKTLEQFIDQVTEEHVKLFTFSLSKNTIRDFSITKLKALELFHAQKMAFMQGEIDRLRDKEPESCSHHDFQNCPKCKHQFEND